LLSSRRWSSCSHSRRGRRATTLATLEIRFVALLALVSPLVVFSGSVLRAI